MKAKYAAFLPHLCLPRRSQPAHPVDVLRARRRPSPRRRRRFAGRAEAVPGGLLGADYAVENGRYRFKKVFGGLNWTPELRAPLAEPGSEVKAGEYLLAVDGRALGPPDNLFARFENDGRQDRRDHGRAQPRRQRLAHRQGRARRRRGRPAQPRLGRGEYPQGRRRRRTAGWPTSTSPTRRRSATSISSATSSPRPTRRPSSSTSASTGEGRSPITTSTGCGSPSPLTGPCATAPTSRRRAPRSRGRRS